MKAFTLSALLALLLNSIWLLVLMYAIRHDRQSIAMILLGGYAVVVLATALISIVLFQGQKWQAVCGVLAVSLVFVGGIGAGVVRHHQRTTITR